MLTSSRFSKGTDCSAESQHIVKDSAQFSKNTLYYHKENGKQSDLDR